MTKKRVGMGFLAFFLLFALVLTGCGDKETGGKSDEKVLNVFNWSEYLPQSVIDQFEEETGIKVNYDTYSSNEEMLAKLSAGNAGYDITVASTYFIEIMIKQEMLAKINKENIPNIKNIGEDFLGTSADPNDEYSVPYMWGKAVIAVNEDLVEKEVTSYADLFDPEFKNNLVVLDDVRSIVGTMLAMLGYSQNSTDEKELEEAKQKLLELKPNIKAFDSDSPKTLLVSGEVKAGIVWGAEATLAAQENAAIKTVFPSEGLNLWQDNFVIPKDAPHKENAEKFIDFILRPEISKEISMDYPYGNPNVEAVKLLPEDIRKSLEVPSEVLEKGEYNIDVGEATQIYDRIWSEVKNN
ncbi:ABC transporter substrate-binding protein [Ferdinandcohnia quinoae]|uniref:Spermidine/putrescine ABC transporter substrate-binding protein n=1 Tax=Fredinandcohnia quinoae TaxID=2918902 RepID=A0AAW5E700_9BACI|nr:spermidine/putrescine ABC transporter substrate-binding protein [Fredinandcohnia sp. SECRCQ15]MCH1625776.1 spermidine/putrescine ABC transporter substrate-binding protein [Fredinandcohnia sp. SECRCQ15]